MPAAIFGYGPDGPCYTLPYMNLKPLANKRLTAIWSTPDYAAYTALRPMLPASVVPGGVLFLGINPSYRAEDVEELSAGPIYYQWKQPPLHHYYQAHANFMQLVAGHGQPLPAWSNLDMLYMRNGTQETVRLITHAPEGRDFVGAQLKLTVSLIRKANPAVLIVANNFAATLLGRNRREKKNRRGVVTEHDVWLGYSFPLDEELGTCRCPELGNMPVVFVRPFNGLGSINTHKESTLRLAWQIRRLLRGLGQLPA
jgi:hypothetical protein